MPNRNTVVNRFSMIPSVNIQRSKFDRSHEYKTTFDAGFLIPFFIDEYLPGDTFVLDCSSLVRMATPIYPVMDSVYLDTFFFSIPCRLLWDHFQNMMGERDNPDDTIDYIIPTIKTDSDNFIKPLTIGDFFGLPTFVTDLEFNALPFRAYNLVYNEWFRDENLVDRVPFNKGDGPDDLSDYKLLRRAKSHDYFTSALPWPQKGEGAEIPLSSDEALGYISRPYGLSQSGSYYGDKYNYTLPGSDVEISGGVIWKSGGSRDMHVTAPSQNSGQVLDLDQFLVKTDLSAVSGVTIESLREAFALQHMLETDARGGTRYTELLRAHFGVISPDARLQRPEYLGGSSNRINFSPVPQMNSTDSTSPQGNLAAYAVGSATNHVFSKSFTEHGYILGLCVIRTENTYQQGVNRLWNRSDRYDFYWPELAHLGEQEILNKEIYAQGTSQDDEVFGFQERYAEYRYFPSYVTGAMRSNYSLDTDYTIPEPEPEPTPEDDKINVEFSAHNEYSPLIEEYQSGDGGQRVTVNGVEIEGSTKLQIDKNSVVTCVLTVGDVLELYDGSYRNIVGHVNILGVKSITVLCDKSQFDEILPDEDESYLNFPINYQVLCNKTDVYYEFLFNLVVDPDTFEEVQS